jgi:hypothetical protein
VDRFTSSEQHFCEIIRKKDRVLRDFLRESTLPDHIDAQTWLTYLTGIKSALGNLNNDLAFVATLLVKHYLQDRFGISDFDAAGKAQGAAGVDIEAVTKDGKPIVGELKTTKPYQPAFGAQQRTMMLKDLKRLAASDATHRFMFVADPDAFTALCKPAFANRVPGVEIVDLVTGRTFLCEGPPE